MDLREIFVLIVGVSGCWVDRRQDSMVIHGCRRRDARLSDSCPGLRIKGYCTSADAHCVLTALVESNNIKIEGTEVCMRLDNGMTRCVDCDPSKWTKRDSLDMMLGDVPPPTITGYDDFEKTIFGSNRLEKNIECPSVEQEGLEERVALCEAKLSDTKEMVQELKIKLQREKEKNDGLSAHGDTINLYAYIEHSISEEYTNAAWKLNTAVQNSAPAGSFMREVHDVVKRLERRMKTYRNAAYLCHKRKLDLRKVKLKELRNVLAVLDY